MVWSAHMLASVTAGLLHSLSWVHFGQSTLWPGVTACCPPCPLDTLGLGEVSTHHLCSCSHWLHPKTKSFSKFQCKFSILLSQLIENGFKKNKILKTVGCYCCFIYSRSFSKLYKINGHLASLSFILIIPTWSTKLVLTMLYIASPSVADFVCVYLYLYIYHFEEN